MRILLFGDIYGRPGRDAMIAALPDLKQRFQADFVSINAENAAGGTGLTEKIANALFDAGADCLTLGNHSWDQVEMRKHIQRDDRIVRPANLPDGEPGLGVKDFQIGDMQVSVIQVMGQVFMHGQLNNPFVTADKLVSEGREIGRGQITLVDFHAEATSEKNALGQFLDGRVSSVTGTHTHVPTADTWIMPGGTLFQSDLGMCGDYNSIIGSRSAGIIPFFLGTQPNMRFQVSKGPVTICGMFLECDDDSGKTLRAEPIRIGGVLSQTS